MLIDVSPRIRFKRQNVGKRSSKPVKEGGKKMHRYKGSCSLSSINEGDEHTSLQNILNVRETSLEQDELWAVCRECALALKRVSDSNEMLQSLVVMLETLAFDSQGNVCFIDIESGTSCANCKPPEYEKIGNSCKGHVYSLGILLYEASAYNTNKMPEHTKELTKLLNGMITEDYQTRLDFDAVIEWCDLYFKGRSSHNICKRLVSHTISNNDTDNRRLESTASVEKLLTTSTDMSMQDLVDKYTPAYLKDASSTVSLEDIMPEPPAAFKENHAGLTSAFTATNSSPSASRIEPSNKELSPLSSALRAGGTPPRIPAAFNSSATHFIPIVISNVDSNTKSSPSRSTTSTRESQVNKKIKELKRNLFKTQNSDSKQEELNGHLIASSKKSTDLKVAHKPTLSPRQSTGNNSSVPAEITPISANKSLVYPHQDIAEPAATATTTMCPASTTVCPASTTLCPASTTVCPASTNVFPASTSTSVHDNPSNSQITNTQNSSVTGSNPITAQTFIPPYSGIPFMVQQDPSTGTMQFIPVMANISPTSSFSPGNTQGALNYGQSLSIPSYWGVAAQQPFVTQSCNTVLQNSPTASRRERDRHRRAKQRSSSSERVLEQENKKTKQKRSQSLGRDSSPKSLSVAKTKPPVAPRRAKGKHKVEEKLKEADLNLYSSDEGHPSDTSSTGKARGILKQKTAITTNNITKEAASASEDGNLAVAAAANANQAPSPDSGIDPQGTIKYSGDTALMDRLLVSNQQIAKITKLIRDEFAYDGYLDNSAEVVTMSEFIVGLDSLKWDTLCSAIVEKYCDLFWSEELLAKLYEVVNGKPPAVTGPASAPGALRSGSARVLSIDEPSAATGLSAPSPFRPIGAHHSTVPSVGSLLKPKAMLTHIDETENENTENMSVDRQQPFVLNRHKSASEQEFDSVSKDADEDLSYQVFGSGMNKSLSQTALHNKSSMSPIVNSLTLSSPGSGNRKILHIQGKNGETSVNLWDNSKSMTEHGFESPSSATTERRQRLHKALTSTASLGSSSSHVDVFNDSAFGSKLSSEYDASTSDLSIQSVGKVNLSSIVFFAALLDTRTESAMSLMNGKSENKSVEGLDKKLADLDQQIRVNCIRRNKALHFIKKLRDNPQSAKGGHADYKVMLRRDHEDALKELEYLAAAKNQLLVLLAERWSLEHSELYSFTKVSSPLIVVETAENPCLQYHTVKNPQTRIERQVLYAGKPIGLMSYLFARDALTEGYLLDFFHTFRYFTKSDDLFAFLADKYSAALLMDNKPIKEKVVRRCLDIFNLWLETYYSVDFKYNPALEQSFINFVQEEVCGIHIEDGESLLRILDEHMQNKRLDITRINSTFGSSDDLLDDDAVPITRKVKRSLSRTASIIRKTELEEMCEDSHWTSNKSILTIGSGKSAVKYRKIRSGLISCAAPSSQKVKSPGADPSYHPTVSRSVDAFNLTDFTAQQIAEQLTLNEQAMFQGCHPVHFMNSLAQGIGANLDSVNRTSNRDTELQTAVCIKPLFVGPYSQENFVQNMIENAQRISYWVTAELISCNSNKAQAMLLSKFLQVAKICKEIRNFSTCVAIKDGLDNILIRHIPAWKDVPCKLTQELDSLKLLLKSESKGLSSGEDVTKLPTIPSVLLFIIHVQQLEQGGFTLANGMYRWNKLRSLAKLVDQIRLFRLSRYCFEEDAELNNFLDERIREMCGQDLHSLALDSSSQKSGASKWSGVLQKMKTKLNK